MLVVVTLTECRRVWEQTDNCCCCSTPLADDWDNNHEILVTRNSCRWKMVNAPLHLHKSNINYNSTRAHTTRRIRLIYIIHPHTVIVRTICVFKTPQIWINHIFLVLVTTKTKTHKRIWMIFSMVWDDWQTNMLLRSIRIIWKCRNFQASVIVCCGCVVVSNDPQFIDRFLSSNFNAHTMDARTDLSKSTRCGIC